jgi:ribonuclease D
MTVGRGRARDRTEDCLFEETPLVMIVDVPGLEALARHLSTLPAFGIDTESDSSYAYQEKVCLIQVSDLERDYIIDPLLVKDLSALGKVLADPDVVKVLHGGDYDVVSLDRDFGFRIRGLFDTLIAAQLLGMERIGLADLIGRHFGIDIDKAFQRHNWSLRPLLDEHVEYARGDTHYLLALREILVRELLRVDRLRHHREECRFLERRKWHGRGGDPFAWMDLKGANDLDEPGRKALRELWRYREEEARRMDRPVYKVIPDDVLVELATVRPRTERELDSVVNPKSTMRRRHGRALLSRIGDGLADDGPLPERPEKKEPKERLPWRIRLRGRAADRVFADLKNWRNEVLGRDPSLSSFSVASNGTLRQIAQMRPRTLDELERVPEVRRWQVRDFGEEILARLERIDPSRD